METDVLAFIYIDPSVLLGATLIGFLCGLLPFLIALFRSRLGLGVISLICCIISAFIFGVLLALPVAVVFALVIGSLARQTPDARTAALPVPPPNGTFNAHTVTGARGGETGTGTGGTGATGIGGEMGTGGTNP